MIVFVSVSEGGRPDHLFAKTTYTTNFLIIVKTLYVVQIIDWESLVLQGLKVRAPAKTASQSKRRLPRAQPEAGGFFYL